MTKLTFREVETPDYDILYDDDGIKEISGKNNTLYVIVPGNYGRYYCPVNAKEYEALTSQADRIATDFCDLMENLENGYAPYYFQNFKEICNYYGIKYSPVMVKRLKEWAKTFDNEYDDYAAFLSITTGEEWDTYSVCGYCQGDYAIGIYCKGHYDNESLELYVGAAAGTVSEFCRIEPGEYTCYGFFVPDVIKWDTDKLKEYLANFEGDKPENITIELFNGYSSVANYTTV